MVGFVGSNGVRIPFAGKNTSTSRLFKAFPDATDASEKVDEVEVVIFTTRSFRNECLQMIELCLT